MSMFRKEQCSKSLLVTLFAATVLTFGIMSASASESHHSHDDDEHDSEKHDQEVHIQDEHNNVVAIDSKAAGKLGISTAIVEAGIIERHLQVYGRLVTPSNRHVQVRGRFPGLIQSVKVNVGDSVNEGDVLASIESNESLQTYHLRAPISAVVQARFANEGEVSGNAPLFTLINSDQLWAELKVFPSQRFEVVRGLDVHVIHRNHTHDSQIVSITPSSSGQPYVIARVLLSNHEGDMAPGDMVSGDIDAEKVSVPVRVDNRALQVVDNKTVVFVQESGEYTVRPVQEGRTDGRFTEVLSGLNVGERYVVENSYLLKADLLKSGASHSH